jgi:hypothetical protein
MTYTDDQLERRVQKSAFVFSDGLASGLARDLSTPPEGGSRGCFGDWIGGRRNDVVLSGPAMAIGIGCVRKWSRAGAQS